MVNIEWAKKTKYNQTPKGKEYQRRKRERRRIKILTFLCKGMPRCQNPNCLVPNGCIDIRCLQIDHVNGHGIGELRKLKVRAYCRKIKEHPENYQVLCANCNWIKRFLNKEFGNI